MNCAIVLQGPSDKRVAAFIEAERLAPDYARLVRLHFLPLASWIASECVAGEQLLVGLSGAQGTGKSTLARFLALALTAAGLRAATLSLDDYYLTRAERSALATAIHPLLATRGVPGTHDVALLESTLDRLAATGRGAITRVPRFDKSCDDRVPETQWRELHGPIDVVLLEGWCVGSVAEDEAALATPVNRLEAEDDPDGRWRRWVNDRLAGDYARLTARLDRLVYLAAPHMDAIFQWRLEQEEKLRDSAHGGATAVMEPAELHRFVQHFERITLANARVLPDVADAVLEFDGRHDCIASRFRRRTVADGDA